MKFLAIICLPFLWFSCDSLRNEVDPDRLNKEAEKLVVVGFLSPQDSVLAVQISRSVPVLGQANTIRDVGDATVIIRNGSRFVALKYVSNYNKLGLNLYVANARDFPISAGQTYALTVETPAGQKATSQCTIPVPAPLPELQLDSAVTENGSINTNGNRQPFYVKFYSVRATWTDIVSQRNYYRMSGVFQFQATPPVNSTVIQPFRTQNMYVENTGLATDSPTSDGRKLIKDGNYYQASNNPYSGSYSITGPSGTTFIACPTCATVITTPTGTTTLNPSSSVNLNTDPNQFQLGKLIRVGELTISLLHTDENYYHYHDAINRQQDVGDNPFAEPVQIPTNIVGGLGCFAGYNRSVVVLKIK